MLNQRHNLSPWALKKNQMSSERQIADGSYMILLASLR